MPDAPCITLYDITGLRGPWNPYPLRSRFALNFKAVPFKTLWLEYPEIEPTLKDLGVQPTIATHDGVTTSTYTLPIIVDSCHLTPEGGPTIVSDSWAIAEYIDKIYPHPTLMIPEGTSDFQSEFIAEFETNMFFSLVEALVPVWVNYVREASVPYFRRTREQSWGKPIDILCPRGSASWNDTWNNAHKGFSIIAALLDKNNGEGASFLFKNQVTYADLVVASWLESIRMVLPNEWETRVRLWNGGRWERHLAHCQGWMGEH